MMVLTVKFCLLLGAILPVFSATTPVSSVAAAADSHSTAFNPLDYVKFQKVAHCKGVNRANPDAPVVKNLNLQYTYIRTPKPRGPYFLYMAGPVSGAIGGNKLSTLLSPSYNILVPTIRGFGPSTHPGDVQTSGDLQDLVEDLACVMRTAGVKRASCLGHDWGAEICWSAARSRPDIIDSIAAVDLPYQPAVGNFTPIADLVALVPHLGYQVYFQDETDAAIAELNKDIRSSLRSVSRTVASPPPDAFLESTTNFLGAWNGSKIPPAPFMSQAEEDYLVGQYKIQGFKFTLELYTEQNRQRAFQIANEQGNFTIPQPALVIFPNKDPVANWSQISDILGSASFITGKLTTQTMETAHWPQLEQPSQFNSIVDAWLKTLPPSKA